MNEPDGRTRHRQERVLDDGSRINCDGAVLSLIASLEPKLDADDLAHKDQAAKGVADTADKVENIAATARQVAAEETLEARSLAQTANLSRWRQRRRSKAWKKTVGFSCRAHSTGWPSF